MSYVVGTGVVGSYYAVGTVTAAIRLRVGGIGAVPVLKDHAVSPGAVVVLKDHVVSHGVAVVLKDHAANPGIVVLVGTAALRKLAVVAGIVVPRDLAAKTENVD